MQSYVDSPALPTYDLTWRNTITKAFKCLNSRSISRTVNQLLRKTVASTTHGHEESADDEWLKGLPIWVVAMTRGLLGLLALGGGIFLAFNGPQEMSTLQATITSSLFAFGIGMLSSFFLGSLRFKRKNAIIATGSFALFLILIYFFGGKDLDLSFLQLTAAGSILA